MPPRARTAAPSDAFHGSFDPGVTGRRTGVAPPLKVRRMSNGVEAFSDYFASPRKDPSVSPIISPNQSSNNQQLKRISSRPRNDRPDLFHEIGERGRKTGISPPKNITRDENGFEEFDNYLIKATEQTNKAIARERRRSLRRKSISQKLHARKLSTTTFVDDDDDEEEFEDESISLATPDSLHYGESRSARQSLAHPNQSNRNHPKVTSGLSNSVNQSTRTHNDSDLIDFDAVPEGPIHSNSRNKSQDDQPMTVHDDDDDDADLQDFTGTDVNGVNEFDDGSVGSDGFDPPAPPPESPGEEADNPVVLEDIMEDDEQEQEQEQEPTAGPSAPADSVHHSEPKKPRKSNPHPPPVSGTRRGNRQRLQRLAHWRGERVVYGRSTTPDGNQRVIGMVDVVRVPVEENESLAQRRNRRKGFTKVKSESVAPVDIGNAEQDLDAQTRPNGIVYSYTKNKDCERSIVCTKRMAKLDVEDQAGVPNTFQFQRLFKGTDFVAGGLLYIPVGGSKPLKPSKDNFYFFTVLEGAVSVQVHRTTFVVAPLGVFWIPRGNVYSIQNVGQRTAKLTFSQARRATGDEGDLDSDDADEEEVFTNVSTSNSNQSGSNIDKNTTISQKDVAVNGESSHELIKSKRARPGKNTSSDSGNKKAPIKKKLIRRKQNRKQQNAKQKKKQPVGEEQQEEEEEDDEVSQTS